jgi:fluoroquinolone resistance protein
MMAVVDDRLASDQVLEDQVFDGLVAVGADLSGRELVRCTFRHAKLSETCWAAARMEDCLFEDCDLTRMQPAKLALRGVTFRSCKLMGVEWSDLAPNPTITFQDCLLRYASFVEVNLRGTAFSRCNLREAVFVEASLVRAVLDDCDLEAASFERCDLREADLARSRGVLFDPARNRVKGAKVSLETAALVAMSMGLVVSGFSDG